MKYLKYLLSTLTLFLFFLLPGKINASGATFTYCNYNDLSLALPVTIGRDSEVINGTLNVKTINEEIVVYDYDSCRSNFSNIEVGTTYIAVTHRYYYYYQSGNKNYTQTKLGNGKISILDITPPNIESLTDTYTVSVDKYLELNYISSFVSAFDDTDGSITPEIIFDGYSENYNKLGTYSIIFQACDKSNNCNNFTISIKVVDDTAPTINGITKIKSYLSNPLDIGQIISQLKATDNYDGDISHLIYLESQYYKTDQIGNYWARFLVKDLSNNISESYLVEIEVIDDVPPTIEGPTLFTSKLSSIIDTKTILSNMIVSDNIDTNAYLNLHIISDNYSNNMYKIGSYTLVLGAYDNSNNESTPYVIHIDVIDDVIPTISGNKSYTSYLSSPLSIITIKSKLIVNDNYDGNLLNKLEIIEDTFTNNKENIGVFYIIFQVKDSSNNLSEPFEIEITVEDDIPPTIDGKNYYETYPTVKIDPLAIKLALTAYDNIDGDLTSEIVLNDDSYSENYSTIGTYFLTFYVSDSTGNISNFYKVKVDVVEEKNILNDLNDSYIHLDNSRLVNDQEIFDILGINIDDYLNVSTIENDYLNNFQNEGTYKIVYKIENFDYTYQELKINVIVYSTIQNNDSEVQLVHETKKETIWQKIGSFIKSILFNIIDFFKNLFR